MSLVINNIRFLKSKDQCLITKCKALSLFSNACVFQNVKKFQLEELSDSRIVDKILYNSKIKYPQFISKRDDELNDERYLKYKENRAPVIALKYFSDQVEGENRSEIYSSIISGKTEETQDKNFNFPYEKYDEVQFRTSSPTTIYGPPSDDENELNRSDDQPLSFSSSKDHHCDRLGRKWMRDYNMYAEVSTKHLEKDFDDDDEEIKDSYSSENFKCGTSDPSMPSSSIPCGGCGAHLHCQDSAIPGFLPKEIFSKLSGEQLQAVVCQRCHFLREYNTALSVSVDPNIYPQLLSQIKEKTALVILVVDMTDFPCSIWPGILNIIGPKRPLVVVGNKIDLLQDWSNDWLKKAKKALIQQIPPKANLLHVELISAKTGYGVEQLVTALYKVWEYRGDVYLVGCTNVGKSTLFNALLSSDYCRTKAVDLVQRATTAPWPGTTLNLLKFPILRPNGWKLTVRSARLRQENIDNQRLLEDGKPEPTPQMIACINRTFSHNKTERSDDYWDDPFAMPRLSTLRKLRAPGTGLDPNDPVFGNSNWLYDTPGVITTDQIIDLLTAEELMLTLAQQPLVPRTFQVWAGQSLLVGGLGRLDYLTGDANIKMTVLAAATLPITLCWTADVDEVLDHFLGTEVLAVPAGGPQRLQLWPNLSPAQPFVLKGIGWKESCADVVLSSAGWVAVTAMDNSMCQLQGWTPGARGLHVRIPPVLPRAIAVKGKRMYKSQAYALYGDHIRNRR